MEKFFPALLSYKPWPLYSSLSPEQVEESGEVKQLLTLLVLLSDHTAETEQSGHASHAQGSGQSHVCSSPSDRSPLATNREMLWVLPVTLSPFNLFKFR